MTTPKHDFYTVAEVSERLECSIYDIVRWGAEEKIQINVFFSGHLEIGIYVPDGKSNIQIPEPQKAYQTEEELPLTSTDLRKLWSKISSSENDKERIEIHEFKAPPNRYISVAGKPVQAPGDLDLQCPAFSEEHIPFYIGLQDLLIHQDEVTRFQKEFLKKRTEALLPPYLDPNHPFHPPELKIAVETWLALYSEGSAKPKSGGHLFQIQNWLKKNRPGVGPTLRKRIATVVNPNKAGGSTQTPEDF